MTTFKQARHSQFQHGQGDAKTESFSDKAARIATEHKLHPVDAALLADVIEPPTDAYLVVVSRDDEVLNLMVVEATAARFARRAARAALKENWDTTGLSFNARRM